MFDRVRDASRRMFSGDGDAGPDEAALHGLAAHLDADETTEHALWSTDGFERTAGELTETVAPGDDGYAFALVSGRRVLFAVADGDGTVPESSLSLADVVSVSYRESLLRRSLSVTTSDEAVTFRPEGGDAEAVAAYLDRTRDRWHDLHAALDDARAALSAYRDEHGTYDDIWRVGKQVRSQVRSADDAVTRYDDAVADRLAAALAPAATDLATALRTEAEAVVEGVDVDADGAEDSYEQTRDVLEHALAIATEHADCDAAPFEASLQSLDAAIARSQWEWGGT